MVITQLCHSQTPRTPLQSPLVIARHELSADRWVLLTFRGVWIAQRDAEATGCKGHGPDKWKAVRRQSSYNVEQVAAGIGRALHR